jgi:predicted transglutaminase-like cysteine proteinase
MRIGSRARGFACALPLALALAGGQAGAATQYSQGESSPGAHGPLGGFSATAVAAPQPSGAAAVSERPQPFGLAGPLGSGLGYAASWREAMTEVEADRAELARCRADTATCTPAGKRFLGMIDTARAREGKARIGEINRTINLALAYTSDLAQHAVADRWSAPLASFASGRGDCEDYAIAKYLALTELGVSAEDLRLVLVETRTPGSHAVLTVRFEGRWLVLDNARFLMVEDRDLSLYRGLVAFGGETPAPALVPASAPTFAENTPATAPVSEETGDLS